MPFVGEPEVGHGHRPGQTDALLLRTPATLRAWFTGLSEAWLTADEGPDTFGARDVLTHLIHGERTDWMPRLRLILAHGESRAFEPFDRRGFLAEARTWTVEALLDEFARLRAENLRDLRALSLSQEDLARRGTHPALGAVTVEQLLAAWVVHDLGHLAQAARVMAKRYSLETGPWIDYLPVLTR
jgi:hypothetical protein